MSRRGENIYKRQDGRWEARYVKRYDTDGKIRYGYCYGKTYREAKEKVMQVKGTIQTSSTASSSAYNLRKAFLLAVKSGCLFRKAISKNQHLSDIVIF